MSCVLLIKKESTCTVCGRPLIQQDAENLVITQGYPSVHVHKSHAKICF